MSKMVTEWVNVVGDISIIARESGEVWFHTKQEHDPFAAPMTGAGSEETTVRLLDGAINLGFAAIEGRLAQPAPTIPSYILALVGAYHTSVDTPRNLRRAAKRFEDLGRPEVAAYLEERAREETGHDRLALKDLRALGVPGERLVANFIPEGIKPLCKRFDDLCVQDYPIGCIGYSYCLERIGCDLKRSGPRDCSRSAATVSWVGHRRCRPRAKLSCALGKAEISAVKNAHIIACAGSDIVRKKVSWF